MGQSCLHPYFNKASSFQKFFSLLKDFSAIYIFIQLIFSKNNIFRPYFQFFHNTNFKIKEDCNFFKTFEMNKNT